MTIYDNYLDMMPTRGGKYLGEKKIEREWQLICQENSDISTIVEVGPGFGEFGLFLDLQKHKYVALENNPRIASFVNQMKVDVCCASVPPFPIKSSSADLIYASHVIEHMPDPKTALLFIKESFRVLSPGGILILSAPDFTWVGTAFWEFDYTHTFPITKPRLQQLLRDAGFYSMKFFRFSGPFTGTKSILLGSLAKILIIDKLPIRDDWKKRLLRVRTTFFMNICVIAKKAQDPL
jgi:SAM-dependent methyltransferase